MLAHALARMRFHAYLMDIGVTIRFVPDEQIVDVISWRLWL